MQCCLCMQYSKNVFDARALGRSRGCRRLESRFIQRLLISPPPKRCVSLSQVGLMVQDPKGRGLVCRVKVDTLKRSRC